MNTARQEFSGGCKDTLPLILGAIPFGIIFGALATSAGLSIWATLGLSLFVFAGSAQFVAAGLVAQGTGIGLIIFTTFIVNLRHGLYSASLGPYMKHLSQRWLLPLGFWLTDESYAVVIKRYREPDNVANKHWYYLGSALTMYVNWQLCTVIGIVTGQSLSGMSEWGLEIALVVSFIGIVIPLICTLPMFACAVVAGIVALVAHPLPNQAGLMLAAIAGIATGWLIETLRGRGSAAAPQQ